MKKKVRDLRFILILIPLALSNNDYGQDHNKWIFVNQ